jgi:hypothetical protein
MSRVLILSTLAGAAVLCAAAFNANAKDDGAKPSAMEAAFSNTIRSTYPDGRTAELWLKRDGSYTAMGRRKDRSDGHWSMKGSKLCLKQSHPMAVPFTFCAPVRAGGVGTSWSAKAVSGEKIKVQVVAGRAGA